MGRRSTTTAVAVLSYVCRFAVIAVSVVAAAAAAIVAITITISSTTTTVAVATLLGCIAVFLLVYLLQIADHILQHTVLLLEGLELGFEYSTEKKDNNNPDTC